MATYNNDVIHKIKWYQDHANVQTLVSDCVTSV